MVTKKPFNNAFTLAEVLITLGIIGIVAALTIPAILNYTFEREAVSRAKKEYAILSEAVEGWQEEGSCVGETSQCPETSPQEWPGGAYPHQATGIAKIIASKLKVKEALYAPSAETLASTPWIPAVAYGLSGAIHQPDSLLPILGADTGVDADLPWGAYFLLDDGTVVKIAGIWWYYDIVFDINGAKKPNRYGKDQFAMSLYTYNYPSTNPYFFGTWSWGARWGGSCSESQTSCNPDDGKSPLAYVLKHDKLPNMKSMGYPSLP